MLRKASLFFLFFSFALTASGQDARQLLDRSIAAMGGEAGLRAIQVLHLETIGHEFLIEQSERPEGPFIANYISTVEDRDVEHGRSRIQIQDRSFPAPDWSAPRTIVYDGESVAIAANGKYVPLGWRWADTVQQVDLAPERVLFLAQSAPDLQMRTDVRAQGVAQHVVSFTWKSKRVRLLLNAHDSLLTAVEVTRPDEWGVWGNVTDTTYYSLWTLLPGGVRYPQQLDRTWNETTLSSTTIVKAAIKPAIDDASFAIPGDVKAAFAALPPSRAAAEKLDVSKRRVEVAPGLVQYGGSWNVEVVQQPDGLVVIEAPIGSSYSVQVLDELSRRYPGVKVKALVTTSDAWPHLGGVREYVARGIPVYAMELNRPILERLLAADYSSQPDDLVRTPRAANFHWISAKTTIGSGATQISIIPARQENGERMLFVYMPAAKVLYTSDEIQPLRSGGFFMTEYLQEVKDVVAREGLTVDRVIGMHAPVIPWSTIEAALAAARRGAL
jgi:hypothetical protein